MKARGEWEKYGRPSVMSLEGFRKEFRKAEREWNK